MGVSGLIKLVCSESEATGTCVTERASRIGCNAAGVNVSIDEQPALQS